MTKFTAGQRFRIITGSACFYSTAQQIRAGCGDFVRFNTAVQEALTALENTRKGAGAAEQCAVGIAGEWAGVNVQLDMAQ